MKKQLGTFLLASALLLSACGGAGSKHETAAETAKETAAETAAETKKVKIVTTFYPMYEFTKEIAGDAADVEMLIPAGTEVHGYEPSAKNIADIQEADVFVYEDPNMETWVPSALDSMQKDPSDVIQASNGLVLLPGDADEHHEHGDDHDHDAEASGHEDDHDHDAEASGHEDDHDHDAEAGDHEHEEDHDHEGHHHEFDPHLWLSPYRATLLVSNIRDGLIAKYPEHKELFEQNATAYLEKLNTLDHSYRETLSAAKQKCFVTQHAAFAYLAQDYGLKQVSITGLSADVEPTLSRMEELSQYIHRYGIHYIYFEENAKASVAEALAKETGVELLVLNPLESLTEEQMKNGETYLSIINSNLEALKKTTEEEGQEILPEGAESSASETTAGN